MRFSLFCALTFLLASLTSCETTRSYGVSTPQPPMVALPDTANSTEQTFLPEVEAVLRQAGYQTSYHAPAEYALNLQIKSGTLDAEATIQLSRQGQPVTTAYAQRRGASTLIKKQQALREAFHRALAEFSQRLPKVGPNVTIGEPYPTSEPPQTEEVTSDQDFIY